MSRKQMDEEEKNHSSTARNSNVLKMKKNQKKYRSNTVNKKKSRNDLIQEDMTRWTPRQHQQYF
jgi:hypothetical protein